MYGQKAQKIYGKVHPMEGPIMLWIPLFDGHINIECILLRITGSSDALHPKNVNSVVNHRASKSFNQAGYSFYEHALILDRRPTNNATLSREA
jgi:hypothetical protein